MKKTICAVSASAFAVSALTALSALSAPEADNGSTVKIMCVGDSITDGYTSEYSGSYRKFIYNQLTSLGYDIDMVGNKDESGEWLSTYTDADTGETFSYDNANTGYSGYAIRSYAGRMGIYEVLESSDCLKTMSPDIVTLQIGTNDIIDCYDLDNAGERLGVLIDFILENISESSALFVTTIPDLDPNRTDVYNWFGNYRHSADWQVQYDDETAENNIHEAVKSYNAQVQTVVKAKQAQHKNLYYADVNSAITDVKTQLFDGVHPNNTGYKAMGTYWTGLLSSYMQGSTLPSEPETKEKFCAADMVKLCKYLLGDRESGMTVQDIKRYDLDGDGRCSVFDFVAMRQEITENSK